MSYTIYTRTGCTFCDTAKRYMREHGVDYKEVYLTTDDDVRHVKSFIPEEHLNDRVRLPIVFKNQKFLGDHEALIRDHQVVLYNTWNPKQVFDLLKNNVCTVVYDKINGDRFQIKHCTLAEDRLPEGVKHIGSALTTSAFLTVYDLDTETWSGFNVSSIKSITVTGE